MMITKVNFFYETLEIKGKKQYNSNVKKENIPYLQLIAGCNP